MAIAALDLTIFTMDNEFGMLILRNATSNFDSFLFCFSMDCSSF